MHNCFHKPAVTRDLYDVQTSACWKGNPLWNTCARSELIVLQVHPERMKTGFGTTFFVFLFFPYASVCINFQKHISGITSMPGLHDALSELM